jgi:hypothetical protein
MKTLIVSPLALIATAVVLVGCAGSPAKLITATEKEVAVSISKKDARDLDTSLESAGEVANEACGNHKKTAKFTRTEEVAEGLIAHFDCIVPAKPAE